MMDTEKIMKLGMCIVVLYALASVFGDDTALLMVKIIAGVCAFSILIMQLVAHRKKVNNEI